MRAKLYAATACLFAITSLSPADAERAPNTNQFPIAIDMNTVEVGTSVICDTQKQMEQFVSVLDQDPTQALQSVNADAKKSDACGIATIAYLPGKELDTVRSKDQAFRIVHVLVVGIGNGSEFKSVSPSAFYSLVQVDEIGV
jgi:hypothetical protein